MFIKFLVIIYLLGFSFLFALIISFSFDISDRKPVVIFFTFIITSVLIGFIFLNDIQNKKNKSTEKTSVEVPLEK